MPSMKKDAQRQTLFSMAGELRDEDIAAGNKRFIALLNSLTGKTIEEYKRQITAAKNRIKGELQEIPGRIDECKRSMPVVESWIALEKDLKEKQEDIRNVEAMLADLSTSYEKESKVRVEVVKEISQKKVQREQIKSTIENEIMADYRDKKNKRQSLILKLNQCRNNEKAGNASIEEAKSGIEDLKAKRDELVAAWYSINGEQITFDDNQFVCPTCKRGLDSEDIETLKAEMSETFNANKAARLLENQKQGMSIKARIEASNRTLKTYEQRLEEIQNEIGEIIFDNLYQTEPVEPETASKVSSDQRYITISAEITELEKKIEGEIKQPENAELKTQRNELQEACRAIERRLINKTTIDNIDKRIAELDTQYKVLSQELAENEGVEFTIDAFSKAKVETVEKRINSMFAVVRWKMFEKQINGGEVPTCEAMVNGVPFSDVNKADQINAGIDIINAICHHRNVFAPIFVDNAESVNSLLQTNSQIIRLVVTLDNQITVQ